ncbi:unnamed protein product [Parajaminaea phylloscopi]
MATTGNNDNVSSMASIDNTEKVVAPSSKEQEVSDRGYGDVALANEEASEGGDSEVFATGQAVEFRGVSCIGAAFLVAKLQFGLGILGVPLTFHTLGLVPGIITLLILSAITSWTGVILGDFRNSHPDVQSIGDAAFRLFGTPGREAAGVAFWLLYTFCYGSAALSLTQAFNALSDHSMCTMGFLGIAAAGAFVLGAATRTLKWMSYCSYVALTSIFLAVWITAIACLAQSRPAAAPLGEEVNKNIRAVTAVPFSSAMAAVSTQLFALGGTPGFLSIHAEMRNPLDYRKAFLTGQSFVVLNYIIVSVMIYCKVGVYITSPALGSAGPLIKKISYGIALPSLFYSAFFQAHLAAKYTFVRSLRGTRHLQQNTLVHWSVWLGGMTVVILIGFVVAGAIPFFGDLLGLIGAFLMPHFCLVVPCCMLLYSIAERHSQPTDGVAWIRSSWLLVRKSDRRRTRVVIMLCYAVITIGTFIFVAGTYGSIKSILDSYASGSIGKPFSCADNQ